MEVELDKHLLRGTKIKLGRGGEVQWVDFTYKMLPTFCFYCGMIGHTEKTCERKKMDARESKISEGHYGGWLRATEAKGGKIGKNSLSFQKSDADQVLMQDKSELSRVVVRERAGKDNEKEQERNIRGMSQIQRLPDGNFRAESQERN